jgi:glycosyltransferase involved in cell wall biosynthesis
MLPRYDLCGVPYTLGPLGGGEATPWRFLRTARLPAGPLLSEFFRPWLNNAAAAVPALRAVMRGSRLALGTTYETERVLRRMGARNSGVAFPDYLPADVDSRQAQSPAKRASEIKQRVRLIWSGRAVWWKAGQLAVELLRRLVAAGVNAELSMFSYGHALDAWRRQMNVAGVASRCRISGFVPRDQLLTELGQAHAFVFPTLHDSANASLLEAYAMGLPSLTVGLGGPAVIATERTGYNVRRENLDAWLEGAVACVHGWQQDPATWLAASEAAQERANEFRPECLETMVDRWLGPAAFTR